jgi:hypothetical protein
MINERTKPTMIGWVVSGVPQMIHMTSGMLIGIVPRMAANVRDRSRKTATIKIMTMDVMIGKIFCRFKKCSFLMQKIKRLRDKEIERFSAYSLNLFISQSRVFQVSHQPAVRSSLRPGTLAPIV